MNCKAGGASCSAHSVRSGTRETAAGHLCNRDAVWNVTCLERSRVAGLKHYKMWVFVFLFIFFIILMFLAGRYRLDLNSVFIGNQF